MLSDTVLLSKKGVARNPIREASEVPSGFRRSRVALRTQARWLPVASVPRRWSLPTGLAPPKRLQELRDLARCVVGPGRQECNIGRRDRRPRFQRCEPVQRITLPTSWQTLKMARYSGAKRVVETTGPCFWEAEANNKPLQYRPCFANPSKSPTQERKALRTHLVFLRLVFPLTAVLRHSCNSSGPFPPGESEYPDFFRTAPFALFRKHPQFRVR
jgi:hypothetical protein